MCVWPRSPHGGGPPIGPASGGWRVWDLWRENGAGLSRRRRNGCSSRSPSSRAVFGELRDPIAVLIRGDLGGFTSLAGRFGRSAAKAAGEDPEAGQCGGPQCGDEQCAADPALWQGERVEVAHGGQGE